MEMTDRDGYEEPVEGLEAGKPRDDVSIKAELEARG